MRRTLELFLAIAITLTLALVVALATEPSVGVKGGTAKFDCYLIVDKNETVPAVTFSYTITSGGAVEATSTGSGGTLAVSAGLTVTSGATQTAPTITPTVAFTAADDTDAKTTKAEGDTITLGENEKYVKKEVTVDFNGVTFPDIGIYRYVITESVIPTSTANETVTIDGTTHEAVIRKATENAAIFCTVSQDTQAGENATRRTRYMDVCVTQENSGLVVSSYVLHTQEALEKPSEPANGAEVSPVSDKSTGIVNSVSSHNLTFGKEVIGNQGSKNKYFQFTLTLGGLGASEKYAVDLTKADTTVTGGMSNPGIVTASGGACTGNFYLKDGQYITIQGLPNGFIYELSEDAEAYTSTPGIIADNNADKVAHTDPVSTISGGVSTISGGVTTSIKTGFTNERSGIIPTGILLTVTPFVVGLFLFGAMFVYMMARKRRAY